jgi:hypothetical protein
VKVNSKIKVSDPPAWGQCDRPVTHSWERRLLTNFRKQATALLKFITTPVKRRKIRTLEQKINLK